MIPDWCEANYAWSPYIAEWWNTWSSVLYILLGLRGLHAAVNAVPHQYSIQRVRLCFYCLMLVGVGSSIFHATLTAVGQAADELAMIACIHSGLSMTTEKLSEMVLVLLSFVACVFTYCISSFYVFTLIISLTISYLVFRSYRLVRNGSNRTAKSLYLLGVMSTASGFFLFWLPEHALCVIYPVRERGSLQKVPLHAMWHVLTAFGAYAWILAGTINHLEAQYKRERSNKVQPTV